MLQPPWHEHGQRAKPHAIEKKEMRQTQDKDLQKQEAAFSEEGPRRLTASPVFY